MDEALKLKSGMMPETKNDWTNRAAKKNALVRATALKQAQHLMLVFIYLYTSEVCTYINNLERRMKNIKCKNR